MESQNSIEEINLIDVINTLIKRKKIIFWCVSLGILFAVGVYLAKNKPSPLAPTTYQATALIEVGQMKGQPIERIENVVSKINSGVFCNSVTASNIPETFLVSLESHAKNKEEAKTNLANCMNAILSEQDGILKFYKDSVSQKIANVERSMNKFVSYGQPSPALEIIELSLKDDLANASPSKIVKEPDVLESKSVSESSASFSKKFLKIIFMLIVGAFAGFFAGLIIILVKEWWDKNKNKIIKPIA